MLNDEILQTSVDVIVPRYVSAQANSTRIIISNLTSPVAIGQLPSLSQVEKTQKHNLTYLTDSYLNIATYLEAKAGDYKP
jgi:hypothetical protein